MAVGGPMRVATTTELDVDIETLWRAIQTPALLLQVTRGLMGFRPLAPAGFPEVWDDAVHETRVLLFGWLPAGRQTIAIERPPPEPGRRVLRDHGRGDMCDRWDHLMILEPLGPARTRYTDAVDVEAGRLTLPMAAFGWGYYALRQRNLRRLVAAGELA